MFKVNTVHNCPATRGSRGVMQMTPEMIGEIAGMVRDRIEWIVLLKGERSDDGYTVAVQSFDIPKQYRSYGDAELVDDVTVDSTVVGVMHSHHTMGAFFSGTDRSSLNPRFPSSIVVASSNWTNLGFKYEAVGKVKLPCGSVGEVPFRLSVVGVSHITFEEVRGTDNISDIGDCDQYSETDQAQYFTELHTACGLVETVEAASVFGQTGQEVIAQIEAATETRVSKGGWQGGKGGWNGYWSGGKFIEYGTGSNQIGFTSGGRKLLTDGGGQVKGKKRKRGKLSARRNGLVKLERPEGGSTVQDSGSFNRSPGTYVQNGCDNAGANPACVGRGMLRWNKDFDQWLCWACTEEADEVVRQCEAEADDSVIAAGEIEVLEEGRFTLLGNSAKRREM